MRKILESLEIGFAITSLILYTGGPLTVLLSNGASEGDLPEVPLEFAQIRLVFLVNYIITFGLLMPRWRKVLYLLAKEKFILLLITCVLASIFWSFLPGLTIQRSVGLLGTTLFGAYLATRYTLRQQLELLTWTLGTVVAFSFIFAIALPKYGIMGGTHAGAWRGIYNHKNVLGKIMVLSAALFWMQVTGIQKNRFWLGCNLSLSILLLVLARSTSSLINFVIIVSASCAFRVLKWRSKFAISAILLLLALIASLSLFLFSNAESLLTLTGKDASLTGRANIWPAVLTMIGKQPWIGYGYSGFWKDFSSEGAYVWRATDWTPPNAHNGILDLLLDLGLLGLLVFLGSCLQCLMKSLTVLYFNKSLEGLWALTYLTYIVLANITESSLLIQNNIFWVLYVSIALSLQKHVYSLNQT